MEVSAKATSTVDLVSRRDQALAYLLDEEHDDRHARLAAARILAGEA